MTDPTQRIPVSGSWHNRAVIEHNRTNQPGYSPRLADDTATGPSRARLAGLRILICLFLAPLSLALAASGALAWWTQTTLVDPQGFSTVSNNLARDSDFQKQLAEAVTTDIMTSEAITSSLGNGNESGLLGGAQNFVYNQVQSTVSTAADTVVRSESYPQIWQQVMADTHTYNLDNTDQPAALDISAVYSAVDTQVGSILGYDPDIAAAGNPILSFDSPTAGNPVHRSIMAAKNYAGSWALQLGASLLALLIAFLLWPAGRFYFASAVVLIAAAGTWIISGLTGYPASAVSSLNASTEIGRVFVRGLATSAAESLAQFAGSLVLPLLVFALLLFLTGIALQITRLTARAATARTRNRNNHVG